MNKKSNKNTFVDVIMTLSKEGRKTASKLFSQQYFFVTDTPQFMKDFGLTGDSFTISYGTISRHFGKDPDHSLNLDVWKQLPEAIVNPFAITEYYKEEEHKQKRGYRLYTSITAFENEIYRDTKTNPQQAALFKRPNFSQYPSVGDSDCKDTPNI